MVFGGFHHFREQCCISNYYHGTISASNFQNIFLAKLMRVSLRFKNQHHAASRTGRNLRSGNLVNLDKFFDKRFSEIQQSLQKDT